MRIASAKSHPSIRPAFHLRYKATSTFAPTKQIPRSTRLNPHPSFNTRTRTRLLLVLGLGATSIVASAILSSYYPFSFSRPYIIHADADRGPRSQGNTDEGHVRLKVTDNKRGLDSFEEVVEADGDAHIECQPAPGVWRRDSFQLGSNFPIEDVISNADFGFSPTLTLSCVTILDGHNGQRLADLLGQLLPIAVLGSIADVYSKYAESSSSSFGFDVAGGQEVQFAEDQEVDENELHRHERGPGELPNPTPPGEELDAAIREAFLSLDEFLVHESVRAVFGLDTEAYVALCGRKLEDGKGTPDVEGNRKGAQGGVKLVNGTGSATTTQPLSRAKAMEKLSYANAGACAIMGIFNPEERSLRVALTGDLRAVFGRRVLAPPGDSNVKGNNGSVRGNSKPRYMYEAEELTADQNARNPAEAARLTSGHPDEPDLLKNNRVLGWGPARAFGDGAMKWCAEVQRRLHAEFLGDRLRENCKTPPYFTAEPVITQKEGIRRGDFVVLASDGLWDCLGSEEVVGLVGMWLEERGVKERVKDKQAGAGVKELVLPSLPQIKADIDADADRKRGDSWPSQISSQKRSNTAPKIYTPSELPVVYPSDYKDQTQMYRYWRTEKKFVCKDENVATHLTRNALGGADSDLREALTLMDLPRARRFRDDISIVVVFFD